MDWHFSILMQFGQDFYQNCPFTDSLHRLSSRFARTSFVPLEKIDNLSQEIVTKKDLPSVDSNTAFLKVSVESNKYHKYIYQISLLVNFVSRNVYTFIKQDWKYARTIETQYKCGSEERVKNVSRMSNYVWRKLMMTLTCQKIFHYDLCTWRKLLKYDRFTLDHLPIWLLNILDLYSTYSGSSGSSHYASL